MITLSKCALVGVTQPLLMCCRLVSSCKECHTDELQEGAPQADGQSNGLTYRAVDCGRGSWQQWVCPAGVCVVVVEETSPAVG
jgi:hypothetical protein